MPLHRLTKLTDLFEFEGSKGKRHEEDAKRHLW